MIKGLPASVTIVEVGPRDGLQNEKARVPAAVKVEFIERLAAAGLPVIEATSFVNPKWVPQLADAFEVFTSLHHDPAPLRSRALPRPKTIEDGRERPETSVVRYPVLVPNVQGLERAIEAGAREVAVFASATESFSKNNLNRSRKEALEMFRPVCSRALEAGLTVRGYVSMVLGDPWEGKVPPGEVVKVGLELLEMGCSELSLGDTIGVGTAEEVQELIASFLNKGVEVSKLAVHFHDTYGQGLANVLAALQMGVSVVDASAGGIGGCPFAKSATGNLATEDLVWMLDGLGISTGVDVNAVASASNWICAELGIPVPGRVARALAT